MDEIDFIRNLTDDEIESLIRKRAPSLISRWEEYKKLKELSIATEKLIKQFNFEEWLHDFGTRNNK